MSHHVDLYGMFNLQPQADMNTLKKVYRNVARRFHPDVNPNPGAGMLMQELINAYSLLSDPAKRERYDQIYSRLLKEPRYFSVEAISSRRSVQTIAQGQVIYTLLKIMPNPEVSQRLQQQRPALNLTLILDNSKSMQGERLERLKIAAHKIIDHLQPHDIFNLVTFSDRAETLVAGAHGSDPHALKAQVSSILPRGGTELYQGLAAGMAVTRQQHQANRVNHMLVVTDGQTYDNPQLSRDLAKDAAELGIGISALGIGEDWNDFLLDEITSTTGGYCQYVRTPQEIVTFMQQRIQTLGATYVERLSLTIAPDPDVTLEEAYMLTPQFQPISDLSQPLRVGSLSSQRPLLVLLKLRLAGEQSPGFRSLVRVDTTGDIIAAKRYGYRVITESHVEMTSAYLPEAPAPEMMAVLGKLSLYQMQQKAQEALAQQQFAKATTLLENLSDRLLEVGERGLAETVFKEAQRTRHTQMLSEAGRKQINFGTRYLNDQVEQAVS